MKFRLIRKFFRFAQFFCFALLGQGLLISCANTDAERSVSAEKGVSAFLYTDNDQEEAYIKRYNELFSNGDLADLNIEISRSENVFYGELMARYYSENLPDIFSIWDDLKYHNLLESKDLADLSGFGDTQVYSAGWKSRYAAVKMLPVRYSFGNVMLINMSLLRNLKFPLDTIVTFEDLINLLEVSKGLGHEFLVLGDAESSSLSDLFFSAGVGWIERSWLQDYDIEMLESEQFINSISNFYTKLPKIFPDPALLSLKREQAEEMFLAGKALLILGSSDQLLSLLERNQKGDPNRAQAQWDFEWLSFPQTVEKLNYAGLRGAVQGDVLGVAMAAEVADYHPILYNEVASVLYYYTGLYANIQRTRKWGIPVPYGSLIAADRQSTVMDKTVKFFNSINYVYSRPSLYLNETLNSFIDQSTQVIVAGQKSAGALVRDLVQLATLDREYQEVQAEN